MRRPRAKLDRWALLAALVVATLVTDAGAQASLVETHLGEAWRWRKLESPDRTPPTFRSVRPWNGDGLIASDKNGLAWTDGYEWRRAPGWGDVGVGELYDAVKVSRGLFAIWDGALNSIDDTGRMGPAITLRYPRRLMPAARSPGGPPLVAVDSRILALESAGDSEPRVVGEAPPGTTGINAVAVDGTRAIWAATNEGLFRDTGGGWTPMLPTGRTWPKEWPMVRAVAAADGVYFLPEKLDAESVPWFWDGEQLVPLAGELRPGMVSDATAYTDGSLIVATTTPFLIVYSAGVGREVRPNLTSNDNIISICVTPAGRLGLVTTRKELWVADLRSERWRIFDPRPAGVGRRVNALAPARDGGLWLGTDRGIARFHDEQFTDVWTTAGQTGIRLESITAVREDAQGRLWVGSGAALRGALCLQDGEWRLYDGPDDVGSRYIHSINRIGDALWFAELEGADGSMLSGQLVRLENGVFTRFSTDADGRPLSRCYDVVRAGDGRLFAAFIDDVYSFDGDAWRRLGITELDGTRAFALHFDDEGTLWIGLGLDHPGIVQWRDGVARRLYDGDWRRAAAADFCQTDDGRLWVTSLSGAFLAEGDECRELTTRLDVREFWPILAESSTSLWLGSLGSGLVHLQPDDLEAPRTFGAIEIAHVEDGGVIATWDSADRWHMTPPDELRFRIAVDGIPRDVPISKSGPNQMHQARLGALEPGDHRVSVVGVDLYGNAGREATLRTFTVAPPVWHSAPMQLAFGALLLAVGGVAWVLLNRRRERVAAHRRQAELAERLSVLTRRLFSSAEDERRKLSRELHDDLGQALTSIGLDLQIAERKGQSESGRIAIDRALHTVRGALDRVRAISSMLRPAVLDDLGLEQAVRTMLSEFTTRTGVDGQLEIQLEGPRVPEGATGHIYRILQEALTNVSRHAAASTVFITLRAGVERIELTVKDDGAGFQTADVPTAKRFGLLGIRERSELMGGSFTLESAPGAGTTIHVSIPLKPPDSAPDPA